MSYTVLARRYRSDNFDQVVGQEPIARTLRNALATGRIAHAYLFTGTRGVGKTSMARLLARALNCPDTLPGCPRLPGDFEYPPKDVQERMAQAIMRGEDLNVIEIDGASNNSVDNARQLIANASLAPTGPARFKIYIIDEVHMLSTAAFNALLKTMEEPPAHVKFILCTTEPHKVPVTIQSRCQRFDFRNIPTSLIARRLKEILAAEKIEADENLVFQVARLGNGSMRDALSLLDRLIAASSDGRLTEQLLQEILGLPPQERLAELVDCLARQDIAGALKAVGELLDQGISQDQLLDGLIERLRTLMLIRACGLDSPLVELPSEPAEIRQRAQRQAEQFDVPVLVYMIALCENVQRTGKSSSHPRALLEAAVVRMALAERFGDLRSLLESSGTGAAAGAKKKVSETQEAGRTLPAAENRAGGVGRGEEGRAVSSLPGHRQAIQVETDRTREQEEPFGGRIEAERVGVPAAAGQTGEVWSAVLASVAGKAPLSWVGALELARLEGGQACLALKPGRRELYSFVAMPARKEQLANLLKSVLGRPVRVEILPPTADVNRGAAEASQAVQSQTKADWRTAAKLPMVQEVMEVFDAQIVEVYSECQGPAASTEEREAEPRPRRTGPVPERIELEETGPLEEEEDA